MSGWQKKNETKNFPVWLPSHPPFYDMEANCFPVSENAENKPDLDLMGKKEKAGSGTVRTGKMNLFWWGSKIFRRGGLE